MIDVLCGPSQELDHAIDGWVSSRQQSLKRAATSGTDELPLHLQGLSAEDMKAMLEQEDADCKSCVRGSFLTCSVPSP